ncbi:hypothetical protein SDC9_44019 [bioreactor metagenome]|uniref:Uncharacterized protein n=1 Tax=bioreactor metagenome TaxID=1076179 RepID=A0A644W274_9ZZZZ
MAKYPQRTIHDRKIKILAKMKRLMNGLNFQLPHATGRRGGAELRQIE